MNKLAEDSIYSTDNKTESHAAKDKKLKGSNAAKNESLDELFDPSELSKAALREQLNQGPFIQTGRAADEASVKSFYSKTYTDHMHIHRQVANTLKAEGQSAKNTTTDHTPKSNFHNYVC